VTMPTSEGFVEVDGGRLFHVSTGASQRSAIVFLHGFTLDHRMWRRQLDALGDEHRCVAWDARGFGRSSMPTAPYAHWRDAAAVCDRLGIDRVLAVGHSIGGHQLLELALARPGLVVGFVAVALSGLASVPFPDDVKAMFGAVRKAANDEGIEAAKKIWSRAGWFASAREDPALARELDGWLADYSGWHWTHDNPAQNLTPPPADRLAELSIPTLVVTGARDLPYNDAIGDLLVRSLPGSRRLHLEGAGHMTNMEAPDAVNGAIAALARELSI
jgi:3-oxoadipate enol-lactonase